MMVCFDFSSFSLLAETKNFWGFLSLFTVDSAEKREDFLADVNVTVKICFRRRCVQGPRDILTESKADSFVETLIKRFEFLPISYRIEVGITEVLNQLNFCKITVDSF